VFLQYTGSLIRRGNLVPIQLRRLLRSVKPSILKNAQDNDFLLELKAAKITDQEKHFVVNARSDRVRKMLREVVLKFPLVLGTSMEKIESRLLAMKEAHAPWEDFVTILRRSPDKHTEWMATRLFVVAQETSADTSS